MTDADLVLGRLDPDAFWSGRLALDIDGARKALATVGEPLGLDAEATAVATVAIIDAHMCDAVRRILSLAGADPRDLDLVAFGGMGAVHAARHAALLGMRRVLIPRAAPAFSALGLLTANHVIDDARTLLGDWRQIDLGTLSGLADELVAAAEGALEAAGISPERRVCTSGASTSCTRDRRSMWRSPSTGWPGAPSARPRWRPRSASSIAGTRRPD